MTELTASQVREILNYDKESGIFTWKVNIARSKKAGQIAGSFSTNGYVVITIKGKTYKAHRLAWLYTYGEWPSSILDHINQSGTDNRIVNLRLADAILNGKNRKTNKGREGIAGASFIKSRKRWIASIIVDKKRVHLGSFINQADAVAAYAAAKEKFHAIG